MDSFFSFSLSSLLLLYIPLFTAVSYLAINYLVYLRRVARWRKANIPFLKPSFLIGHKYFLSLIKRHSIEPIDRIYRENKGKDVVGFFLTTIPMVMIRNPVIIKQVFAKNYKKTFEKAFIGSSNDDFVQNTIALGTDKEQWKANRRLMSPMFAPSLMSGETFAKFRIQIDRMWAHAEKCYRKGSPLDVTQVAMISMIDGASNSAFSLDANSYEKSGDLHMLLTNLSEQSVMSIIKLYAQMQFPGVHMLDAFRFVSKRHIETMRNIIRKQIERRNQPSGENAFIDVVMGLQNAEKNGKHGSDIEITNQMISFGFTAAFGGVPTKMNAGDFSTLTLLLLLGALSLHPEYQERIKNEVVEVMHKHKTSEFTYDVVRDLQFTEQCILETARLYPTTTLVTRLCSEEVKVPGVDYTFKKGELVIFSPYSIHRDPKYFENPDQFDPDRFSPENMNTISTDAFLAFGTGPRKCPGGKLGILRIATMVSSLVYKFKIKPRSHLKQMTPDDFNPKLFSMIPKENILVDVIPRKSMTQE